MALVTHGDTACVVADCKTTGVRVAQFKLPEEPPHRVQISSDERAATVALARSSRRYVITARDAHFSWRRFWGEFERHATSMPRPVTGAKAMRFYRGTKLSVVLQSANSLSQ